MSTFQIDMTTVGWLTSVFAVMGMLTALPAASILNRIGPKKCGLLSLGFAGTGALLGAFCANPFLLMASRVIEGLGVGVIAVVVPSLISMWFPEDKRGLPMGVWTAWMPTGQSLVFLLGGIISSGFGWQGIWWFTFILCATAFLLYLWKVDTPPDENNFAKSDNNSRISIVNGLKSRNALLLCFCGTSFAICSFSFASWIATFWSTGFGIDLNTANTWVSAIYVVEIIMCALVGLLLNHVKSIKKVGALGFVLYGILAFIAFTVQDETIVLPLVILWALGEALVSTSIWTLAPELAISPDYVGFNVGILSVGLNLGILVGPPLSGFLVQTCGWSFTAIILACISSAGALFAMATKKTSSRAMLDEQ